MELLKLSEQPERDFPRIANALFNDYALETTNSIYRLTDIEFYWHSPSHEDKSVYSRHHVDPRVGEWFFHYSGVDIALRDEAMGYGGILIRGMYDIVNSERVSGPQVCAMKLFSGYDAFNGAITTRIIKHEFPRVEVCCTKRKNLGKNARETGADEFKYRFNIQTPRRKGESS